MSIEETVFRKIRIIPERLAGAGFEVNQEGYRLELDFMSGQFRAVLTVSNSFRLSGRVFETEMGEEYLPLRTMDARGAFVQEVRLAYEALLRDIARCIGVPQPFMSQQANRIALAIIERYGDIPDFPFSDDSFADSGVFRHPENQKWYALIMYIPQHKLKKRDDPASERQMIEAEKARRATERNRRVKTAQTGLELGSPEQKLKTEDIQDELQINIINLKVLPESVASHTQEEGIYPAYHMNRRNWLSIRLDETLADQRIMELIEMSYNLTAKKRSRDRRADRHKVWLVPANPRYYNIIDHFTRSDDTVWKQGKGIETGDVIYMYVTAPYSAILYRCTVTQAYSAQHEGQTLMDIHIDERYAADFCHLDIMRRFGVTSVRRPRSMPKTLEQFMCAKA